MDELADQIDTQLSMATDVRIEVQPRAFAAQTMPAVDMYPTGLNALNQDIASFQEKYGGWPINIRVRVQPTDVYAGEDLLLDLMDDTGALSIISALAYDRSVNGLAQTLSWGVWGGYVDFPDPGGEGMFLGSILPIVVVKAHS